MITNHVGKFVHGITGQQAAMEQQYKQNVNIAKHQYQWAVEDMEKAGLNPAMMFGGGGGGHAASASTSIGGGQNMIGNVASMINAKAGEKQSKASMINAAANLSKSFNNDKDKNNNVNAAKIINIIKNL